jgi:hypothetical protein
MLPLIEARRREVEGLCRKLQVLRLDLFGSGVSRRFDAATSDLDFLVELPPLPPAEYADAWFALKEGLEALFGRPVDLVSAGTVANPHFAAAIEAKREAVFAA